MKLYFQIQGMGYEISSSIDPNSRVGEIEVNGVRYLASFLQRGPKEYVIELNGSRFRAFVERFPDKAMVLVNGYPYEVESKAPSSKAPKYSPQVGYKEELTPLMPSLVVKILKKEGDLVKGGEPLIVVSAMKMEYTLKAPYGGRVKKVNTRVGAKVNPGDILVEIERTEEGGWKES